MFNMPLEAFTQDESYPFYIQFGEHTEDLYLHTHDDFCELVIVLSGQADHILDGEFCRIKQGDVFVISGKTEHGYKNPVNFHICNIMFRISFLNLSDMDISSSAGFQALFVLEPHQSRNYEFQSCLRLLSKDFDEVNRLIHKIHAEYTEHKTGWKTLVKAEFLQLVVKLSRLCEYESFEESTGLVKLAPAIAYIEQHYQEKLSVAELAEMSYYSERQFIRLFKAAFGCLPVQYITRLRINNARELLINTQLPVTEIAQRCGYSDSSYFSKLFQKECGASPRDFRKYENNR